MATIEQQIRDINLQIETLAMSIQSQLNSGEEISDDKKIELTEAYGKIEKEILSSDRVQALLAKNDEIGKVIAKAIADGIKKAEKELEILESKVANEEQKGFVQNLKAENNKEAKSVVAGIRDLQEGNGEGILTNAERYEDLNNKIQKAEELVGISEQLKENSKNGNGLPEIADTLGNMMVKLERYKNIEGIEPISREEINRLVDEAIGICEKVNSDITAEDIGKSMIKMNSLLMQVKKATSTLDKLDVVGNEKMNLFENAPDEENRGYTADENIEWLKKVKEKISKPENINKIEISDSKLESINKLLTKCKIEIIEFLKENENILNMIDKENFEKCKTECSIQDLQNYIDNLKGKINDFNGKILNIDKEQLNIFIDNAKKLREAYKTTIVKNKTQIGESEFELDDNKFNFLSHDAKEKNLEEIKKLSDNDEFKKLFENEAKKLAGTKPVNKWYQSLLERLPIIRRFYKSPEKRYEIKLEEKRGEVVKNLTQKNIDKVSEVSELIEKDKENYHERAVKKTFEKKKAIDRSDKNEILSSIDKGKTSTIIPPKQTPKKSSGPER